MTAKHEHTLEYPLSLDKQAYKQELQVEPVKSPKYIIAPGDRTLLLESRDSGSRNGTIKHLFKDLLTQLDHQDKVPGPLRPDPCVVFSNTGAYPGNGRIVAQNKACESRV
jgi:hypothetical protein